MVALVSVIITGMGIVKVSAIVDFYKLPFLTVMYYRPRPSQRGCRSAKLLQPGWYNGNEPRGSHRWPADRYGRLEMVEFPIAAEDSSDMSC